MNNEKPSASGTTLTTWPPDGLEAVLTCPLCGSGKYETLYANLTDLAFRCAPGTWTLYQCRDCKSAYLNPRPTKTTISLAYESYYTHECPERQETSDLPVWRRFVRALANGYRNKRYGGKLEPANALGGWVVPLVPKMRLRLDQEMRFLPHLQPGASLLDVGFGSGQFLALARRIGWRACGVDPDPAAVAAARKLNLDVRQGDLTAFADSGIEFDVITMSHVIEHLHDPNGTLQLAYRLLRPGGVLFLDTPNLDAQGHRRFKEYWRGLEAPRHLVIFNWPSLKACLARAGFRVDKELTVSFASYASLARASRAMSQRIDPNVRQRHHWRDAIQQRRLLWSPFTPKYTSEFVTIIARKPVNP